MFLLKKYAGINARCFLYDGWRSSRNTLIARYVVHTKNVHTVCTRGVHPHRMKFGAFRKTRRRVKDLENIVIWYNTGFHICFLSKLIWFNIFSYFFRTRIAIYPLWCTLLVRAKYTLYLNNIFYYIVYLYYSCVQEKSASGGQRIFSKIKCIYIVKTSLLMGSLLIWFYRADCKYALMFWSYRLKEWCLKANKFIALT